MCADAPGRLPRRRGAFPDLETAEARSLAVQELLADYYAASTIPGIKTRMDFLYKALGKWGQEPWPPLSKRSPAWAPRSRRETTGLETTTCLSTGFLQSCAASSSLGRFGALRRTLLARAAAVSVQA